ncbi:MAG: DUF3014 domain-containing protein [Burkholderiaceae bacterium]
MLDSDHEDLRPPRQSSRWSVALVLLTAALALGAAAYWWYAVQRGKVHAPAPEVAASASAPAMASSGALVETPAPGASAPQYHVEADAAVLTPADAQAQLGAALTELLGRKAVLALLQTDGFVERVVATVDNLPRESAPARMWPVQPTAKRFIVVEGAGGAKTISPDNGARYTPFVLLVETVDMARAVALYAKFYPLFQQAYEKLGYPGAYFNDRLVAVIDHLLLAPEPAVPLQVTLTEVKGDVPSQRPWVRYEFADTRLERLSAGQKVLVRVGLVNERRLKTRLNELRRLVATAAAAKKK